MGVSHRDEYQASCMLSHDLINKLTVVVGTCDLLQQRIEQLAGKADPDFVKKVALIRKVSKEIVEQMAKHTCRMDVTSKGLDAQPSAVTLAKTN